MSEPDLIEHQVSWGRKTLSFTIARSKRKTLGIQVHPNLAIKVIAPEQTPIKLIEEKVRTKAAWILKQQGYFLSFHPLTPPRQYVSGETHLYLGRQYRLRLHVSEESAVKLKGAYIHIWNPETTPHSVQRLLEAWYRDHAKRHFQLAIDRVLPRFTSFELPSFHLHIQQMEKRWGSCSSKGRITLNVELIKAPKGCIDYVVVHELCHLIHPNHTQKFFGLLTALMPNWEYWKDRLENFLA